MNTDSFQYSVNRSKVTLLLKVPQVDDTLILLEFVYDPYNMASYGFIFEQNILDLVFIYGLVPGSFEYSVNRSKVTLLFKVPQVDETLILLEFERE